MGEKIKIIDFVNNQLKERYKSFVVFAGHERQIEFVEISREN